MNQQYVSNESLPRKKGETDEEYKKRLEKYEQSVLDYWTEERMKNAKPMEMPNPKKK